MSFDTEDDFRSGCWTVGHQQKFLSELPSPTQKSHYTGNWYSWVQKNPRVWNICADTTFQFGCTLPWLFFLNLTYWTYSSRPQMAGMNFILMTTFPNKELTDDSQKLSEANLLNAVIVQRFKWVRTGTWWLVMDEEVWHWIKMHATRTWLETRESDFEFSLPIGCREWSRTPGLHLMGFMTLVTFYCPSAISANNYK